MRFQPNRFAILFSALALSSSTGAGPGSDSEQEKPRRALVSWSGPKSAIHKPLYLRVQAAAEWRDLWEKHLGQVVEQDVHQRPLLPEVDFDTCTAVAIFCGEGWNSDGVVLASLEQREKDLLLRFDQSTYQTASALGGENDDGGVRVSPYGIFLLPRVATPIVIEENVQHLIGHPPKWKERARLP